MRKMFSSLKSRIRTLILVLFIAIALLLLYNNYFAAEILRAKIYEAAGEVLAVSQRRLGDVFSLTSSHLATFAYQNVDIKTLEQANQRTTSFHTAMERIRRQFSTYLPVYSVDSFFYYNPNSSLYFANINTISTPMRSVISSLNHQTLSQAGRRWISVQSEGEYYLIRAVRVSESYIGAWIRASNALELIHNDLMSQSRIYLLDPEGVFLTDGSPSQVFDIAAMKEKNRYSFVSINNNRWLATIQPTAFGNFWLLSLIPDAAIASSLHRLMLVIIVAATFAFISITFGAALLHRWILRPIRQLTDSIHALKHGDFSASLPENVLLEYQEVNNAFNTATKKIEAIKIDMYEDRLKSQEIQMQYLQLQIPPHFLINCLNTIYQLTDIGQLDLTRKMIHSLSRHLRYTLFSGKTVRLEEELRFVENYVEISCIRYPDSIRLYKVYDNSLMGIAVIPLLILNFIENAVKFEAQLGKQLDLHVITERINDGSDDKTHICIWDTGDGFSEKLLEELRDIPAYIERNSKRHLGIANVFQRAEIIMPGCVFNFSNRSGAGAQIDIIIPGLAYRSAGE